MILNKTNKRNSQFQSKQPLETAVQSTIESAVVYEKIGPAAVKIINRTKISLKKLAKLGYKAENLETVEIVVEEKSKYF